MLGVYLSVLETAEDKAKIEEIYKEYKGLAFKIAVDFLKNDYDAEDAVQDAFLKICKYLHKINIINCHKTKGLIVIVIENVCKNILKRRKIVTFTNIDDCLDLEVISENSVEEMVERKITIEQVKEAMSQLSHDNQELIKLRYFYQFSNDEIAMILEIDSTNVRKRVERAKQALQKTLKRKGVIE